MTIIQRNMKQLFIVILLTAFSLPSHKKTTIEGRISGINTQTSTKILFKRFNKIDSIFTNSIGYYKIHLPLGEYDITIKQSNKKIYELKKYTLNKSHNNLNINLFALHLPTNNPNFNNTSSKRSTEAMPGMSIMKDDVSYEISSSSDIKSKSSSIPLPSKSIKDKEIIHEKPSAGQLTAGHWRDLDEWAAWTKTNEDPKIKNIQNTWGIFPNKVSAIRLSDKNNQDLAFAQVELINKEKKIVWQTFSNQDGMIYLWPGLFENSEYKLSEHELKIKINDKHQNIKDFSSYINSKKNLKTNLELQASPLLEIAFVVDATGSMGDEIRYLQSELTDVINRIQKRNRCLQIKSGSVFYKDHGDDYLTRVLPLSYNPATTVNFIGEQSAGGGGDFPEAIDVGIEQGLNELGWSQQHNPKIMFLILDAPPHQDESNKKRMRNAIVKAAEMGIRIVPITASGIDKSTEFLMKYLAIATGGEYVYITDDSKIGNSHLKPSGGESKVTFLNNLMVKIINQYSDGNWCSEIQNPNDSIPNFQQQQTTELIAGKTWHMTFMPNPVIDHVNISFSKEAEKIKITDIKGNIVYETQNHSKTSLLMNVQSWHSGVYVVYATYKSETISGKLLVMN